MDLLFEIGTEEIPPSYIRPALEDLQSGVESSLKSVGIGFARICAMATPRRLAIIIEGLADREADVSETVFGPPANRSFDETGKPTQAAIGFAKSQGVSVDDLKTGKKGKGEYVCIERVKQGGLTIDEMGLILRLELKDGISFPKTMRWEDGGTRFARPIRWMTYVIDGKLGTDSKGDQFSWAGLQAGDVTRGHRFLGEQEIKVASPEQYLEELKRNFVIVDHEERKALVKKLIDQAAASVKGSIVPDEDLLERVTFTVEYPLAVLGGFAPKFLEMPGEVVVTALREHQDFFSVCGAGGKLMPYFVAVANTDADSAGKIERGNERVLKARLEDAHFYWEQDLKDGLERMADRLSHVVWQEQLGSLREKAERAGRLAQRLAELTGVGDSEKLKRAACLAKADLTSNMVREKEFSSLQGLMGKEYARKGGEDEEVAGAIFEHYLPRFAGDVLPESATGSLLAIADKLDSVVGCFGIGLKPTGSEDPYALRRQAAGVARIVVERGLSFLMDDLISSAIEDYGNRLSEDAASTATEVLFFVKQRLQTLLVDAGRRRDVVDAVMWSGSENFARIVKRLEAVEGFENDERFDVFVTAFKRAFNITTGWDRSDVDEKLIEEKAETDLLVAFRKIETPFNEAMSAERYRSAMELLLELARPIDTFFTDVMVMVEDEKVRSNRLSLLRLITDRFLTIADFSKMEVG